MNSEKSLKGKDYLKKSIIILALLVIAVILMFPFLKVHSINLQSDGPFHLMRAEEIYVNLKQGHLFTFIATHTFQQTGVGSFLFYPDIFLYPQALLRFIFPPVTAFYIWETIMLFTTFLVSYFCMEGYSHDGFRSLLFALVYGLSEYHIYLGQWNLVLGEFIAYTFLPLVVFGIYSVVWGDTKRWPVLAIGMTLLVYSHVLSVYIMGIFCLVVCVSCVLFSHQYVSHERILSLLKAVILCLLLSAWFFVPIITDLLGKNLATPMGGVRLSELVGTSD